MGTCATSSIETLTNTCSNDRNVRRWHFVFTQAQDVERVMPLGATTVDHWSILVTRYIVC